MLAEMLGRTLGVEALEDRFQIVVRNARALVVDGGHDGPLRGSRPSSITIFERGGLKERALSSTLRNT